MVCVIFQDFLPVCKGGASCLRMHVPAHHCSVRPTWQPAAVAMCWQGIDKF